MPLRKTRRTKPRRCSPLHATPLFAAIVATASWSPHAHAQLSAKAAIPTPVDSPWGLKLAPQVEEHLLGPDEKPARFTISDYAAGTLDQDISLTGSAEIRNTTTVIKAENLHYDQDTDRADAYGNVRLVNNGNTFTGPEAHLKVEANEGFILTPTYHFNSTSGNGHAQQANLLDPERTKIDHGTYTACKCADDPAWYVSASQVDLDSGSNLGVAHNGVLFFEHVPIFASPIMTFPLTGDRQSGLLPPTVGISSTTGLDYTQPYYINIAPNRDLTVAPRIMTDRGVQLSATYRYLSPTYSGTLTVQDLPHDMQTKTNRWAIYFNHTQQLGDGVSVYANYNKVSDATYPEDLGSNDLFTTGTQVLYQQEAGLTYNKGDWSILARVQNWQTLPPSTAPYGREPQLNVKWSKYDVDGFDFGVEGDATRFTVTTGDMTEGDRLYLNPYLSYSLIGPGYFVIPKIQEHFTAYNLTYIASTAPAGQPRQLSSAIPTFSLDSGLVFERPVRLFGMDYIQTLEPRAYYVYTPYHNQNFQPLFDTAEADFGLAEIYTENTFVGNDRIADANKVTLGLTTRFINASTGDERARFTIAQQYYFQQQRVTLVPDETLDSANHSDLLLGASMKLGATFATGVAFQYNQSLNELIRSNIGFAWSPAEREVLNVSYRYTRATETLDNVPINQFVVSTQWPITAHLYGVARVNYDFIAHQVVDGVIGMQYDAECWTLGLAVQRYANGIETTGVPGTGTRILAQLELKGFSKIDNGLVEQFRASVPGYTPTPGLPPPNSRFTNYE
ncbi:LPS-assembly protein LptD [Pararobbsia alpina]|nr:LPS-assembly protein LptD [Pararobbsia alpina]